MNANSWHRESAGNSSSSRSRIGTGTETETSSGTEASPNITHRKVGPSLCRLAAKCGGLAQGWVEVLVGVTLIANVSSADSFPLPESAATLPFVEDWECGLLRPCWSVTGAGPGRVVITSAGGPYNSRSHLTLDSAQTETAARNEVTLKVNLAGASNVVLRFRARGYNNLNPPPAPSRPFLDGADFNGVAVSSEGRHWWEVCSLRSLDYDYRDYEVNLDAAMATNGLSRGSNFWIRFNQYGDQAIPTSGIAFDDITLLESRSSLGPAGWTLLSESCPFTNGVCDPDETVMVGLGLTNTGAITAHQVVATLMPGGGVEAPSAPQSFGSLSPGGPAVTRLFSLTARGACGSVVSATLQLRDGTADLGAVSWPLPLGRWRLAFAEYFDQPGLIGLPPTWTVQIGGAGQPWDTISSIYETPPRCAWVPDVVGASDTCLMSPSIFIVSTNAHLLFRHYYNLQNAKHGGSLLISIGGGVWGEFLTAGGRFISGGYTPGTLWTGSAAGWQVTEALLPLSAAGQSVQLGWRFSTENVFVGNGWYLDSIFVLDGFECCTRPALVASALLQSNLVLSFPTMPGRAYSLEEKTALTQAVWNPVLTLPGTGLPAFFTNSAKLSPPRYFRLRAE